MTAVKRVLITYFAKPPILDYLARAFRQAGVDVRIFHGEDNSWFDRKVIHRVNKLAHNFRLLPKNRHLFADHPLAHRNYRSRRLLEAYREFKPDLVLVIRGIGFHPDVLAQTRPLFGWWVEEEGRDAEVLGEVGRYDGYFFINGSYLHKAQKAGHRKVGLLPHAVDLDAFHPLPDTPKAIDVCFVGGWSPRRQQYIEAALAVTPNVVIYGGKWARRCVHLPALMKCLKGSYIGGEALNRLYNESRIVVNITNWGQDGKSHSGMTMRVVEVPASGAFLLTDTWDEMDGLFEPGVHVGRYHDLADFPRQIAHYLAEPEAREAIAATGLEKARSHCTYDHLVAELLARYSEWVAPTAATMDPRADTPAAPGPSSRLPAP